MVDKSDLIVLLKGIDLPEDSVEMEDLEEETEEDSEETVEVDTEEIIVEIQETQLLSLANMPKIQKKRI